MALDLSNATLEEKVQYARQLGATDDEIRAAVSHGTSVMRQQVDDALRIERIAKPHSEEQVKDIVDLTAVATYTNPIPEDTRTARKGRLPGRLKLLGDDFRESLKSLPITEVIPNEGDPMEAMAVVEQQLTDPKAAIKAAVKESVRNLPNDPYDISALEQRFAEQRQYAEQNSIFYRTLSEGLEQVKLESYRAEYEDPQTYGDIRNNSIKLFNSDLFAFLGELAPRNLVDQISRFDAAVEAGLLEPSLWEFALATLAPGWSAKRVRESILEIAEQTSPEEAIKRARQFVQVFVDNGPAEFRNNFNNYLNTDEIFSDDFLATLNSSEDIYSLVFSSVVGGIANVAEATIMLGVASGGVRLAGRAALGVAQKTGVTGRILLAQNPARYLDALRKRWGTTATSQLVDVSKIEIAQSQVIAPPSRAHGDPIVNFPDGVMDPDATRHLEDLTISATQLAQRTGAGMFDIPEQAKIIDEVAAEIKAAHGSHVRPSMSELDVRDDFSGVDFRIMLGASDTGGFKSIDEAVAHAVHELGAKLGDLEYFRVLPNGALEKVKPTIESVNGKVKVKNPKPGEYYIRAKYEHTFSPDDTRLFDGTPVVTGGWFGLKFGLPSSFLDTATVGKYVRSYLREQELTNLLDAMIAPLFKNLNRGQRRVVNNMMSYAEEFGITNGKAPSLEDLRMKFPDASQQELEGYFRARHFQDTLWEIQNFRLRNNWQARGYKTVSKDGAQTKYHGEPVTLESLKGKQGRAMYDPETGKTREFSDQELEDWFQRGNSVIRLDVPIKGSSSRLHRLVAVDKSQGWSLRNLDRHVLEYRPGYFTRMYEDAHFVRRINKRANIDGKIEEHASTVRVAATAREAETFRVRVIDAIGRRKLKADWNKNWTLAEKEAKLEELGYSVEVGRDSRLSDNDRVQIDLEKFRLEGRLFFDEKQPRPLKNTDNKTAEVVDPINVIQRTGRMVSRQVATEDLVNAQKLAWEARYGGLIKLSRNDTSAQIDAELSNKIRSGTDAERKELLKAQAWWRYIRFMEGTMNTAPSEFRRMSIRLGEWVDYNIGRNIGGRAYTKAFARQMGRVDVVQASKSLAFLHFLTARPVRQLLLQGMQHINLQALDLSYIGKWQSDTFSLLSAMKRLSRTQQDSRVMGLKREQAARMMGLDDEEMEILMTEFSSSGMIPGVNVHSYAGGQPKSINALPKTALGGAAQSAGNLLRKPIDFARAMGFDLGEQFNVTASYLMALRKTMKERGYTSLKQLNAEDWDFVANRGSQYALAMHKANAAPWQYGLVSLPLQFLQFTHKWLLTMLGAVPKFRRMGLANNQFTLEESIQIVAAQAIMWGGAGFAVKDHIRAALDSEEWAALIGEEGKDKLASGAVDYILDNLVRNLAGDPDLNFAWDDTFAPGGGLTMFLEKVFNIVNEPIYIPEILAGPSGAVYGKAAQAIQYAQHIYGRVGEDLTPGEKAVMTLEVMGEGLFASFSDFAKIQMARQIGQWTNRHGAPTGIEAKFEEMVVKGVLGINSQKYLDYWRVAMDTADMKREIRNTAQNHASTIYTLFLKFKEGQITEDRFLRWSLGMRNLFEMHEESGLGGEYREAFQEAVSRIQTDDGTSLQKAIVNLVMRGYTGDIVDDALGSGLLPPEIEPKVREWQKRQIEARPGMTEREIQRLEREAAMMRSKRDGE